MLETFKMCIRDSLASHKLPVPTQFVMRSQFLIGGGQA